MRGVLSAADMIMMFAGLCFVAAVGAGIAAHLGKHSANTALLLVMLGMFVCMVVAFFAQ